MGLEVSGDEALQRIRDGWRVYVCWGECWIVDGEPELDSRQRIFVNGKKLRMGREEPALRENDREIEKYIYRTRPGR